MSNNEPGSESFKQIQELKTDTKRAIQKMARSGLRQLGVRPQLPNYGFVSPNHKRARNSHGSNILHSVSLHVIAPMDYKAPFVDGLTNVALQETFIEQDIVRYRLFKTEVLRRPQLPLDRSIGITLKKIQPNYESNSDLGMWRYGTNFKISERGYAHPTSQFESRPAGQLAIAALVGQAINQAQATNIPLAEASMLYASWQELDSCTPQPPSSQQIWSIFDGAPY